MTRNILLLTAGLVVVAGLAGATASPRPMDAAGRSSTGRTVMLPVILRQLTERAATEYGVDFISAPDQTTDSARYARGISTGAGWNRWPLYWYQVETSPDHFDWADAQAVIVSDQANGLRTEVILMGTPGFYASGGSAAAPLPQVGHRPDATRGAESPTSPVSTVPAGLGKPVFADGTDLPGPGKQINPANKWARFVNAAVATLGPAGVTHWEIWNEPDYTFFWSATPSQYARLLKVAFLSARQADADAKILFGGLSNFQQPAFLADVLATMASDPLAPQFGWFFDILATHSYSYAWESWYHVWRAGNKLRDYGLSKPIWLNESGTPAWDDYPGPTWDPASGYRSTMQEGAAYVIQSALYAKYAGAAVVFHFQLYDDCGNQPAGTDFPPNDGSWCQSHTYCAGDAFGLFRNRTDALCFRQHPSPDTPRPVFAAFRVLTTHLGGLEPLWRQRPGGTDPYDGPQEWIAFYRPATRERVVGLWARFGSTQVAQVPATGTSATLVRHDGTTSSLTPVGDKYTLQLGPATNRNLDHDRSIYAIGGPPLILVERDTRAPQVQVTVPGALVPPAFTVSWSGQDLGSGMQDYDVWVSVDSGPLMLWLKATTATSAGYEGEPEHVYGFAAIGRDRAGNQSTVPSNPQAEVLVGYATYQPLILQADGS